MNIAKLNTVSLDDKTFIIKRGEGGGTTINNQDKVVDITENGTTEIVADGGYTGLGKVTINTEVSGGDDGWEYYKFDGVTYENTFKDAGYSDKEIKDSMFEVFPFYIYCHGVVSNRMRPNAEVNLQYYLLPIEESKPSYINGFKQMISLDAIKGSALDGVTSVAEAIEKIGELVPDIKPLHAFLTPCTKEEFESLITQ